MEVRRRRVEYYLRVTLGQQVWTCVWQTIDLENDPANIGDKWLMEMQLTNRVQVITEAIGKEFGGTIPPSYMRRIEWTGEMVTSVDS